MLSALSSDGLVQRHKIVIPAAVAAVSGAPLGKRLGTFKKASTQEELQKLKKGD